MATRKGKNYATTQQAGEYGNACVAALAVAFAADADGDVVLAGQLPGGSTIHRVTVVGEALGASSTVTAGFAYKNPADGTDGDLSGAVDTSVVSDDTTNGIVEIAEGGGVDIIATIGGGAVTGALQLIVEYQYNGQ